MTYRSGWDCSLRHYRCFTFVYDREGTVVARYKLRYANYHIPRSFTWLGEEQADLLKYIDGWTDHKQLIREKYEEAGLVESLQFSEAPTKAPIVQISPHLLFAVLRGEMPLSVTADTQLAFRKVGMGQGDKKHTESRFFPIAILSELVSSELADVYAQAVRETAIQGRPVLLEGYLQDAPDMGKNRSIRSSSDINLRLAEKEGAGLTLDEDEIEPEPLPAPVRKTVEALLSSVESRGITEVLSLVTGGEQEFYVLRRYDRDNVLLSTATSWTTQGPWTTQA